MKEHQQKSKCQFGFNRFHYGNRFNIGGGTTGNPYQPYDGYMAEFIFVDGTSYAPTQFGESKNGVWIQ